MEDRLEQLLASDTRPFKFGYIMTRLKLKGDEGKKLLRDALKKLEDKKKIKVSNNVVFYIFKDKKIGKLILNKKGFGFIKTEDEDEEDYFVHGSKLNSALSGDQVEFVVRKHNEKTEAMILKVIERSSNQLIGTVTKTKEGFKFDCDDKNFIGEVELTFDKALEDKLKIIVNIDKYQRGKVTASLKEILGHIDDPGIDILAEIHAHNIKIDFSKETMEEIKSIPDEIDQSDVPNRKDCRDDLVFTIDGKESKDLDDAIALKKVGDDYLLSVHIADVSHYVKEGTELDKDALDRATSVYLLDRVIPMLPRKLSNGICSVNPDVDRFTLSCDILIDKDGNKKDIKVYNSVIRSKFRMTYSDVNKIIAGDKELREQYKELTPTIDLSIELSHIIRKSKKVRGTIDFEVSEPKIIMNPDGTIKDIIKRTRDEAEMLIEDFMVMANEAVSEIMIANEHPFIFRNHDEPKKEQFRQFISIAKIFGYKFTGDLQDLKPKYIQNFISQFDVEKEGDALRVLMLRCMSKANYEAENIGHFGLASKAYTHFTSPIRRYPDLIVHRLLKKYMIEKNVSSKEESRIVKKLPGMCEHASNKEVAAVGCERDVTKLKMCEYMEERVGEKFTGKISGVTKFGMFVELENMIDGLVHIKTMEDDEYIFNEEILTLRGVKNKKQFMIGDTINIEVIGASKKEKTIDFKLGE